MVSNLNAGYLSAPRLGERMDPLGRLPVAAGDAQFKGWGPTV